MARQPKQAKPSLLTRLLYLAGSLAVVVVSAWVLASTSQLWQEAGAATQKLTISGSFGRTPFYSADNNPPTENSFIGSINVTGAGEELTHFKLTAVGSGASNLGNVFLQWDVGSCAVNTPALGDNLLTSATFAGGVATLNVTPGLGINVGAAGVCLHFRQEHTGINSVLTSYGFANPVTDLTTADGDFAGPANFVSLPGPITLAPNVGVSANGSQVTNLVFPNTNQNLFSSSFVISNDITTHNHTVTSIKITETGTVNANANLTNAKAFYDLDNSDPYNCASENFIGGEPQFGATVVNFSVGNQVTFVDAGVGVTPTQTLCIYIILDVGAGASHGETIKVEITNPTTDVTLFGGDSLGPNTAVTLTGSTTLLAKVVTSELNTQTTPLVIPSTNQFVGATFVIKSNFGAHTITQIVVAENGTVDAQNRLTSVDLYYDNDTVGPDYDCVDQTFALTDGQFELAKAFSGPNGTVTFDNVGVAINTTSTLCAYVVFDVAAAASHGQTVELQIANPSTDITLAVADSRGPTTAVSLSGTTNLVAQVVASALGIKPNNILFPATNQNLGGTFVIQANVAGPFNVTQLILTDDGTADAQTVIENVALRYDLDTTAPYDCASETFALTDLLFDGGAFAFNGPNGTVTFNDIGVHNVTNTQSICFYLVFDVNGTAVHQTTFNPRIVNASGADLTAGAATKGPTTAVEVSGVLNLVVTTGGGVGGGSTPTASAPTNLAVTLVSGNPQLTWTKSTNADSYDIFRQLGTSAFSGAIYASITDPNTQIFTDNNPTPGTNPHRYLIRANKAGANPALSAEVSINVPVATAAAVTNLAVTLVAGKPNLTWLMSPDAESYQIFRQLGAGDFPLDPLATLTDPNTQTFPDSSAQVGNNRYKVRSLKTGATATDSVEVSINVPVANVPPVASNDTAATNINTPVNINVVANDSDADGNLNPNAVSVVTQPANGIASGHPTPGTLTYTPNTDFLGTNTFTYQVCDTAATPNCVTATVTVTVFQNVAPAAKDDVRDTAQDTAISIDVVANDTDVNNNIKASTVKITAGPEDSNKVLRGTIKVDPITGIVTYTPPAGYIGTINFVYEVCDTYNACVTARVMVTVGNVPQPPVANDDQISVAVDSFDNYILALDNDSDPNDNLAKNSLAISVPPLNGMIVNVDLTNGNINYRPNANFKGTDVFEYRICDDTIPTRLCDLAKVIIVIGVSAPVAKDFSKATKVDTALNIDLPSYATDLDGDLNPASVKIVAGAEPLHGTITINLLSGAAIYTPAAGYLGSDSFAYEICDASQALALCDRGIATIGIGVSAPLAQDFVLSLDPGKSVIINFSPHIADPDGDLNLSSFAITSGADVRKGSITIDPAAVTVNYQANATYVGLDLLTYQICDRTAPTPLCSQGTATLRIGAAPVPPTAVADAITVDWNQRTLLDVLANDSDLDNNLNPKSLALIANAAPAHGLTELIVDQVTGAISLHYTPTQDYIGSDNFSYRICDTTATEPLCAEAAVSLIVNGPPVAEDDAVSMKQGEIVTVAILGNDSDPNGNLDPAATILFAPKSYLALALDGTVTYAAPAGFSGVESFDYQICDLRGLCDQGLISFRVQALPIAVADAASTTRDKSVVVNLLANDSDADGTLNPASVVVTSGPGSGNVTLNPTTGGATYQPKPGFTGTETFAYQVCDNDGLCASATVTVRVTTPPPPPPTPEPVVVAPTIPTEMIQLELTAVEPVRPAAPAEPAAPAVTVAPAGAGITQLVIVYRDRDADGMLDEWERANFGVDPELVKPDADPDGDGLTNLQEHNNATDPNKADTDGDGLTDKAELDGRAPFGPTDSHQPDSDGDGLSDGAEVQTYLTDPNQADTDADGFNDGVEVKEGSNPNDSTSMPVDENKDGVADAWVTANITYEINPDVVGATLGTADSDGDGLADGREYELGTDPNNADTDGDGYSDALEVGSYGTDPLDPASNPAVITRLTITSPSSGTIIADNLPNFVGATKPDARILLLLAPGPKSREHLAGGRANEAGTFSIKPARPLTSSGSFNFVIAVIDEDAVVIEESPLVRVNINLQPLERVTTQAALQAKIKSFADVNLPAGAERTSALDAEIGDNQPVISGQVPQGSTVIFIWESLLFTSTVIADTTTGEFSIRPPQALPDGQHKVTFYMVKDDVRGPAAVYDFFISEKARQEGGSIRRIPVLAAAGPQIALQQITLINSLINFFQESVWGWIALGAVVLLLVIFLVIRIRRRRLGQNNTPASAI